MALYPGAPNFRTGRRGEGWWKYTEAGVLKVCQSQGLSIIKNAQRYLREHGSLASLVFGGHVASRTSITIDGIFGPGTCKVLYTTLEALGVEAGLLADIRADFEQNNVVNRGSMDVSQPGAALRLGTLRALIWCGEQNTGDIRRVELQSNTTTPLWGVAPANDGVDAGTKLCWRLGIDPNPNGALAPAANTSTPDGGGNSGGSAGNGIVVGATGGLSTDAKIALGIGGGLLLLGTLTAIAMAASKRRRRSPRRRATRQLSSGRRR